MIRSAKVYRKLTSVKRDLSYRYRRQISALAPLGKPPPIAPLEQHRRKSPQLKPLKAPPASTLLIHFFLLLVFFLFYCIIVPVKVVNNAYIHSASVNQLKRIARLFLEFTIILLIILIAGILFSARDYLKKNPGRFMYEEEPEDENILFGRTNRSDPLASKKIHSDDLVSFYVSLYQENGLNEYNLEMEPDGLFLLELTGFNEVSRIITSEEVGRIQDIIRKQEISALNGLHEVTQGLPPMDGDFEIDIRYSSGEKIRARSNDVSTRHYNKLQALCGYLRELTEEENTGEKEIA